MSYLDSLVSTSNGGAGPAPSQGGETSPTVMQKSEAGSPADSVTPLFQKYPFLVPLAQGQLPGVYVPKDFHAPSTKDIDPKVLVNDLGLGLYRPQDPAAMLAIFNPRVAPPQTIEQLDKSGKLTSMLPPITKFIPNEGGKPASAVPQHTPAPAPTAPPANAPSKAPVSVMPRPSGAAPNLSSLMGNPGVPTERAVPGGGVVLNSLIRKVV